MKKLHLVTALPLVMIPITVISSCSSTPSEIGNMLNLLQDTLAIETYPDENLAKTQALRAASSIIDGEDNIDNNIINASIFSEYPWNQIPGENFVTQLQAVSAKSEGTKVLLKVRIAYYYSGNLNAKYYSDYKELIVQFHVPGK